MKNDKDNVKVYICIHSLKLPPLCKNAPPHPFLYPPKFCILFIDYSQKRFHSRLGFGYGILLSIRKMPHFRPLTAHFGGFEGVFPFRNTKSAILFPVGTEVADFVSFEGSIVQI